MKKNVLLLRKDNGENYVFFYDDESVGKLLFLLSKYASDPELSFTWNDANELAGMAARITAKKVKEKYKKLIICSAGRLRIEYSGSFYAETITCILR